MDIKSWMIGASIMSLLVLISRLEGGRVNVSPQFPNVFIPLNEWTIVSINNSDHGGMNLTLMDITPSTAFLLIHAHSFAQNITLSSTPVAMFDTSVTSVDAGITTPLLPDQEHVTWYLTTKGDKSVTVHILVQSYADFYPVPGGCNQEFPMENDPNLMVSNDADISAVQFQFANVGFGRVSNPALEPDCESQWDVLEYSLYLYYIPNGYPEPTAHFRSLQKMSTPENIEMYGKKFSRSLGE